MLTVCAVSITLAGTVRAEPAETVSVGSFAYAIDGYLSSTPAILTGLDATYDHPLGSFWGLRARGGAVLVGLDEITGIAPHGEAGAFTRVSIAPRVALDASLLGGLHIAGLEHKQEWQDRTGPTLMAEAALDLALTDHMVAALGAGYRIAWTASERIDPVVGEAGDEVATGPVVRLNLGWSF